MMLRHASSTRLRRRWQSESGAELVEFALVLPLLLMLIAAIADFAMLFQGYQVATNAVREGARLAILPGYNANSYATVRTRVAGYLAAGGAYGTFQRSGAGLPVLGAADLDVTPVSLDLGTAPAGSGVQVTLTYTHPFLFIGPIVGLINQTFASTLTYQTTAQMRTEIQVPVPAGGP
jgi:Flp pilus assembly protein TadG